MFFPNVMFFGLQENQEKFHIYVDGWPEKVQEGIIACTKQVFLEWQDVC